MRLFALGVGWTFYALMVLILTVNIISDLSDRHFKISSSDLYGRTESQKVIAHRYRRDVNGCTPGTVTGYISDYEGGATYGVKCSSWLLGYGVYLLALFIALAPTVALYRFLSKRAAPHA